MPSNVFVSFCSSSPPSCAGDCGSRSVSDVLKLRLEIGHVVGSSLLAKTLCSLSVRSRECSLPFIVAHGRRTADLSKRGRRNVVQAWLSSLLTCSELDVAAHLPGSSFCVHKHVHLFKERVRVVIRARGLPVRQGGRDSDRCCRSEWFIVASRTRQRDGSKMVAH